MGSSRSLDGTPRPTFGSARIGNAAANRSTLLAIPDPGADLFWRGIAAHDSC
jgi:hypothetical protein